MNTEERRVVILDHLNLFRCLELYLQYRECRIVYFLHSSPGILNRISMSILKKGGWSFHQLVGVLEACHGISPYMELDKIMIRAISESKKDFSKMIQKIRGISSYEKERLVVYCSKQLGMEFYFGVQLYIFLTTQFKEREKIDKVFIRKSAFSALLSSIYGEAPFKVRFYRSFFFGALNPRKNYVMDRAILNERKINLKKMGIEVLTLMVSIIKAIWCVLWYYFFVNKRKLDSYEICIMVFNDRLVDLNNCTPWAIPFSRNFDDLKKAILVLCPSFFNERAKGYYRQVSDDVLVYDGYFKFFPKEERLIKTWALFLKFFLRNIYLYRSLIGIEPLKMWVFKYYFTLLIKLSFFEALFFVNGSKILWVMNENDSETQFAAMAIHRQGGISLGTSWSQVPLPEWNIQKNSNDVFFAWGKRMVHIRAQIQDLNYYYVVSGYPGDCYFKTERERAKKYRIDLIEKYQVKDILTFIDNYVGNDLLTTRQTLLKIYEELFTWIEEDRKNFMIIKVKTMNTFENLPELREKMGYLIEGGRLMLVSERSALYPGLASDVVLGISSITLTSLLATLGRPVIFFDPHRIFEKFPLEIPRARIVAHVEDIVPSIKESLKQNWGQFYNVVFPRDRGGGAIDPFVDGEAALRIKTYIGHLLEYYRKGSPREHALQYANEQFQKKWGKDYVIAGDLVKQGVL